MPTPFEDPRTVLKRYGLRPKRSWGQNFLISRRAIEAIARLCTDRPDRHVIEIGPGLGTLTRALLQGGVRVTAVEREADMCAVLRAELGGEARFELVEADAAAFDFRGCLAGEPGLICGNLPYQITGPILRRITEAALPLERAVFTVQLEVADRLTANPGTRIRGALSVVVQARFEARIAARLKPTAFHPAPQVRSAVIALEPRARSPIADLDGALFDRVVHAAFSNRRKMLQNALVLSGLGTGAMVKELLLRAAIDPRKRAEHLTNEEFFALTRCVAELEEPNQAE